MYAQCGGDVVPGFVGEEVEGYDSSFHMERDLARHACVKRRGAMWSGGDVTDVHGVSSVRNG